MGDLFGGSSSAPKQQPQAAQVVPTKGILPGTKADAAARLGGGISPEFLAGLAKQQGATDSGSTDVLQTIRDSLGQGGMIADFGGGLGPGGSRSA